MRGHKTAPGMMRKKPPRLLHEHNWRGGVVNARLVIHCFNESRCHLPSEACRAEQCKLNLLMPQSLINGGRMPDYLRLQQTARW